MPLRTLIIVVLVAATLSGCGRRSALEEPGARASAATLAPAGDDYSPLDPGAPAVAPAVAPPPAQPAKPRRFFLDFLL